MLLAGVAEPLMVTQRNLGNRRVQHRFLQQLEALLAATAEPIIIADSGFKVAFYREVERLGWRWVGRVRGRDFVKLEQRWRSCKRLFAQATESALRRRAGVQRLERCGPLHRAGADRLVGGDPTVVDRHRCRALRGARAHATRQP